MLCCLCCFHPVSNFRSFSTNMSFTGWDCQPHAQPPTWRTRVSLLVWVITFDLSGMWCHTSSVTTASIALRIIWPLKPHHYVKVGITFGGVQQFQKCSIVKNIQNKTMHFRSFLMWNCSPEESTNGKHLCNCCLHKWYKFIITIYQSTITKIFPLSHTFKTKHSISVININNINLYGCITECYGKIQYDRYVSTAVIYCHTC